MIDFWRVELNYVSDAEFRGRFWENGCSQNFIYFCKFLLRSACLSWWICLKARTCSWLFRYFCVSVPWTECNGGTDHGDFKYSLFWQGDSLVLRVSGTWFSCQKWVLWFPRFPLRFFGCFDWLLLEFFWRVGTSCFWFIVQTRFFSIL